MTQDDVTKPSPVLIKNKITPKQFDSCIIPYYCKNCNEKQCFVCGRVHSVTNTSKNTDCKGCIKKWSIITQTCINKEKNPLCSACKSSSQSSNEQQSSQTSSTTGGTQNSESTVDLATTPTADLHRQIHYNDPEYIIERVVPKDCCHDIVKAIQNYYRIDIDEQTYFTDFKTAKDYFFRSFLYINDENHNLFDFVDPIKSKSAKTSFFSNNDNVFKISFKDVKSLFDTRQVTPNVVNFVLDCLNFYSIHTTSEDTVPNFLFGNTRVMDCIVPHKKNYSRVWEYFSLIQDESERLSEESLCFLLKDWYIKHKKVSSQK